MKSRKNTIATQIKQIYHNLLSKYKTFLNLKVLCVDRDLNPGSGLGRPKSYL